MHPILFQTDLFGLLAKPWALHAYGVLIAIGFLLAMTLAARQAGREGENPDRIVDMAFYVLIFGLVGARAVFIVTQLPEYVSDSWRIARFWQGGLVWYGGFIGGALCFFLYAKKHHLPAWKLADIAIPYMALGHAFGRLGCFTAGCCFGSPTHLPWGVAYPYGSMVHQAQQGAGLVSFVQAPLAVHPTQLYEAGAELLLMALLLAMRSRKRFHGELFLIWLFVYPLIRSVIEVFRGDVERGVYVLSTSQYISILVTAVAVGLLVHRRRQGRHGDEPAPAMSI